MNSEIPQRRVVMRSSLASGNAPIVWLLPELHRRGERLQGGRRPDQPRGLVRRLGSAGVKPALIEEGG